MNEIKPVYTPRRIHRGSLVPFCDCKEAYHAHYDRYPARGGGVKPMLETELAPGTEDVCDYCGYTVFFDEAVYGV